jgi:hypothetical protein
MPFILEPLLFLELLHGRVWETSSRVRMEIQQQQQRQQQKQRQPRLLKGGKILRRVVGSGKLCRYEWGAGFLFDWWCPLKERLTLVWRENTKQNAVVGGV